MSHPTAGFRNLHLVCIFRLDLLFICPFLLSNSFILRNILLSSFSIFIRCMILQNIAYDSTRYFSLSTIPTYVNVRSNELFHFTEKLFSIELIFRYYIYPNISWLFQLILSRFCILHCPHQYTIYMLCYFVLLFSSFTKQCFSSIKF